MSGIREADQPPDAATYLRGLRAALGLTQVGFAELVGVSPITVSHWETGWSRPSPLAWQRVQQAVAAARREPPAEEPGPAILLPRAAPTARRPVTLPLSLSSFIGRAREVADVTAALATSRLVTLTGPGGCGKTRLALEVGLSLRKRYAGRVWLAELAAVSDATLLLQAVAGAVGADERTGVPLEDAVAAALARGATLLVLDNCEHLVDDCAALVAALLQRCPRLHILATSRERLRLDGEVVWPVPPLSLPDPAAGEGLDALLAADAVRLFVERARAARPDFALVPENGAAVARICRLLEGLPLALELAAASVAHLPATELAGQLATDQPLHTAGSRAGPPRHQTLQATLDWSVQLLTPPERVLFRRLAVFQGGWSRDAAEAVAVGGAVEAGDLPALLFALIDKSLVTMEQQAGEGRYRLLEPIRRYAAAQLQHAGDTEATRERHLAWCVELAEQAEPALMGAEQAHWLSRLEMERANLRAALAWALDGGPAQLGMRLAAALWRLWEVRGSPGEGRRWLELALDRCPEATPGVRAAALLAAGNLARDQGDHAAAATRFAASLALWRQIGDRPGVAKVLNNLGILALEQGQLDQAAVRYRESLAIFRDLDDGWNIANALHNLGLVVYEQGDDAAAEGLLEESLARFRALGNPSHIARALSNLGRVVRRRGDLPRATALLGEAIALRRQVGDLTGPALSLRHLGEIARQETDHPRAAALFHDSLRLFREVDDKLGIAGCLERIAALAEQRGRLVEGARLLGAAEALRQTIGLPVLPAERADYDRAVHTARAGLATASFTAAWRAGQAMPLATALAEALAALEEDHRPTTEPAGDGARAAWSSRTLTPRQEEVLRLLAAGHSTKEIGAILHLSTRTVERHLTELYARIEARGRADAIAYALRQGLAPSA